MIEQSAIVTPDDTVTKLPLTDKDKENFWKAVITNEKFIDTVELFDGKHKLTFSGITVEENEDVLKQFKLDEKNGLSSSDNAYFVQLVSYRLGVSLFKIDGADYLPEVSKARFVPTDTTTYVAARSEPFKKWNAFKLSAYINVFNQFEDKITRLGKEIQTQNFWKASA